MEPKTYNQASLSSEWCKSMSHEFNAFIRNEIFSLEPSPPHANIIGCKRVFKIKRHANGKIERYKACLVDNGYHQEMGVDYFELLALL